MTRLVVLLSLVLTICITPVMAAEDEPLTSGRWWAEKTDFGSRAAKAAYVKGFVDRFTVDCTTERHNHVSRSIFCPPNGILDSDALTMGQVVILVESFYRDSRNLHVPVIGATEYVIFSLDRMPPDFLQGFLNDLRAPK